MVDEEKVSDSEQDAIKELRAAIGAYHKARKDVTATQFALDDLNKKLLEHRAACDTAEQCVKRCQQQMIDSVKV